MLDSSRIYTVEQGQSALFSAVCEWRAGCTSTSAAPNRAECEQLGGNAELDTEDDMTGVADRLEKQLGRMPTQDELVAGLTQEVSRLTNNTRNPTSKLGESTLSCRVSEKGALSVYGLGRFPVTLYAAQWEKLLMASGELLDFLHDHAGELTTKDAGDKQIITKDDVAKLVIA